MTVIVWDGKTLACDSMMVERGRKSWCQKFWQTPKGVYAGCGKWVDLRRMAKDLSEGRDPDISLYDDSTVIHLDLSGRLWEYCDNDPVPVRSKDAWGSGRDFALGALSMGATAKEAAQVACKHSTTCGGKIHTFTV